MIPPLVSSFVLVNSMDATFTDPVIRGGEGEAVVVVEEALVFDSTCRKVVRSDASLSLRRVVAFNELPALFDVVNFVAIFLTSDPVAGHVAVGLICIAGILPPPDDDDDSSLSVFKLTFWPVEDRLANIMDSSIEFVATVVDAVSSPAFDMLASDVLVVDGSIIVAVDASLVTTDNDGFNI